MKEVTINAEAIPNQLKERDQWLMWDAGADTPRRPHWRGNFGVSWTDPDDWHSFEAAYEAGQERETWGVGYVFARDNDDYARGLYGALDLDGCVDEDGHPKDWLPSLDPFFAEDAYLEYSPSGEGIHIPLVGFEPPEWWANVHHSGEAHEGVEAYGSKFFTFTGDKLRKAGETVAENVGDAVDKWLGEAYTAITGDLPPLQPDGDQRNPVKSRDEIEAIETTSDTEDILDAIDHLRPSDLPLSSSYTEDENSEWESWDPGYRSSESGKSLKRSKDTGLFRDFAESDPSNCVAFSLLDLFAAEENIINDPWDTLDGDEWWEAVDRARDRGAPIPVYDDEDATANASTWKGVRDLYADEGKAVGRYNAVDLLENQTAWMYVIESETLWVYDEGTGYFTPWGEEYAAQVLERNLESNYSVGEQQEIVAKLQARNQTHREELNAGAHDEYYLCVGNGVINLETGELDDHDPSYKFTRGLQWDYDIARADPELVREFLDDVTKRKADRDTLIDHLAHGLMPGHPYRAFVMMYGPGSNGKTRVGKLFRGFVGEDNAASVELQDLTGDDQFATGGLPGAFVNVGDDISVSEIRDVSILKSVTGSGTIRANEKYEKQYEFENEAAMFFSANEPPRISEESDAIGDRLYPIEMPYRFVDESAYDPDNPRHKPKIPGIAKQLLDDDATMRGLLLLCVEHAQRLIESHGQYSMPEGPKERRDRYEAASDPIQRFALDYLVQGEQGDRVLKDDGYAVYKAMCERDDERVASANGFKRQITQQSLIDVESGKTRQLTPGDSRDGCWNYVKFRENAKEIMPSRLVERYFPGESSDDDADSDGGAADEPDDTETHPAFGASPINEAAEGLTGYVTVTAEVVETDPLGEGAEGTKAILKDESGAIDVVTWNDVFGNRLKAVVGECIVIKNAEVTEYEGTRQLSPVEGLTTIDVIQQGVGHTSLADREDGQSPMAPTADGGFLEVDGAVPDDGLSDAKGSIGEAGEIDNEIPQKKVVTTLKALVELLDNPPEHGAERDEVLDRAVEEEGIDRDRAAARLGTLVEDGDVIEVADGELRNT